jgi:hypothetical protein
MANLEARALARTVFSLWRQHHDWQKRKWRDLLRAKVHFRLARTRRVVEGWQRGVQEEAALQRVELRVSANHLVCLQHRTLQGFIGNVIERRRLQRKLEEAYRFQDTAAMKRGLLGWLQFMDIQAWQTLQTREAVVHWSRQMLQRGWRGLREGVSEVQFGQVLVSQSYSLLK